MGDSSDDGTPFAIEDLAGDAAGVIAELGLERPDVLGWSMGGFVALALALAHPDRVGSLVLLSSSAGGAPRRSRPRRSATSSATSRNAARAGEPADLAALPPRPCADDRRGVRRHRRRGTRGAAPDVARAQWRAMEEWEGRARADRLGELSLPVLVATGSEDVAVPPANSLALVDGIAGAWLARFPHSGHGFMADHPDALAKLISNFLDVD